MNKPNFYKELPDGYVPVKIVDAVGNKKTAVLMNVFAFLILLVVGAASYGFKFGMGADNGFIRDILTENGIWKTEGYLVGTVVLMLVYMVLHELVHGAVYKLMTHEKLRFGISLSCAYCGVPHLYITKKTALLALLAPFTVFNIVFILLIVFTDGLAALCAILLFASHFGGCVGDLYDTFLLLCVVKGEVLLNDNGPKQVFYLKQS